MNDSVALLEAIETLSNIAESGDGVGVMQEHSVTVGERQIQYRSIHWISSKGGKESVKQVRQIFKTIYEYIQDKEKDIEGVRSLMVLVGQAARKLDLSGLMKVQEFSEYRKLENFYNKQIAPKVDQAKLGMWMLALTKNAMKGKHALELRGKEKKPLLVDLEAVKSDREYELFFLKKEDGTRFYNPGLLRNIQLVCHFGERFYEKRDEEDPFAQLGNWLNVRHQAAAKTILGNIGHLLNRFYRISREKQDNELAANVKKCIMALMLASQPPNKVKGSGGYFADFQRYYREILYSQEYQKLIRYPIHAKDVMGKCVFELVQRIAKAIYREISLYQHLFPYLGRMIEDALSRHPDGSDQKSLWGTLTRDYRALSKHAKGHVTGSLERLLEDLHTNVTPYFDPWMQHNYPSHLFRLQLDEKVIDCLHAPCPIIQEFIHKATITEEFKNFLRSSEQMEENHLIFNLQDRTSWKEHARCVSLEELQHSTPFQERLRVVTFAKNTAFYNQTETYAKEQNAELFINNLKEHLSDNNTGFYFPPQLSILDWEGLDPLLNEIHRTYFSGKNVLTRTQRLDFIEIAYIYLQMHLIGRLRPSSFSFMCKDGVDNGSTAAALFLTAMKLLSPKSLSEEDRNMINYILHTPALLNRERVVQPSTFQRFINVIRIMESVREHEGAEAPKRLSKFINLPVFLA